MPHSPKPPSIIVEPAAISETAASADKTTLFMRPAPFPYFACVEKVNVVMLCLVSPGFSSVVGKEG